MAPLFNITVGNCFVGKAYIGAGKVLAVFVFLLLPFMVAGQADAREITRPYKAGELLVKYKTGARPIGRSALLGAGLARSVQAIGKSPIHRVMLGPGTTVEEALAAYAADPDVEIAEPNYIIRTQAIPDDTDFSQQWGLYNTGQVVGGYQGTAGIDMDGPQAWDINTGAGEVIVAVVDTGCDIQHPDLAANIWYNSDEIPGDGIDNDRNGYIDDVFGWDFADNDNNPYDASGHGTHVAGLIAAVGDNDRGIAGVAWQARIMPVRAMNGFDVGTTADAIDAIEYAVDNGAKIINCSWGGSGFSYALRHVIDNADALFVCASGNNGQNADTNAYYPAGYDSPNIISVAATDQMDQLAWFSNYGTATVDVAAPGVRVLSLDNGRKNLWSEDFNNGLGGWITGGTNDEWDVADPPGRSGAPALATCPNGDCAESSNAWAQLPVQNLGSASASMLTFKLLGSEVANSDYLYFEISTNGTDWMPLPLKISGTVHNGGISGSIPYWTTALADLGPWDGISQVHLRFRFFSGATTSGAGFFIDGMRLTVADGIDTYQFMQGTSMAAGYVSGLAALIRSEDSSLTPLEIKFIIENSVDLDQGLLKTVASGGRVNGYNALTLLRELSLNAVQSSSDSIELSWTAGTPLTGQINIQKRSQEQMEFTTIASVDTNSTQYVDQDILPSEVYVYRVQAQTQEGYDGYSHQALAGAGNSSGATSNSAGTGGGGGGGCFINLLTSP
ncbi:MAG: S8 family serine peptidase [Desulfobacteraceae bacterium]|jgi:subtilisin family serine protease